MKNEGITLIALVITIIVLLILAGISISFVIGNNGIITQAQNAVIVTDDATTQEEIEMAYAGAETQYLAEDAQKPVEKSEGEYLVEKLEESLLAENGYTITPYEDGSNQIKVQRTAKGRTSKFVIELAEGIVTKDTFVSASEILDETGEEENKLHIGDFVNYTAGTWTSEEIKTIGANNSTDKPSENFKFGGFVEGGSRDGNATPYSNSYNYVKDKETNEGITGWRLFDVTDEGNLVLISAGCPEDYYHPSGTNYAYISEYILTGNINSSVSAETLGLGTTYKPRDWSMYVNAKYPEATATVLTKKKLDDWYSKYMGVSEADTWTDSTFQKIYGTPYESLIDNYAYYWLSAAYSSYSVYGVYPDYRNVGYSNSHRVWRARPSFSTI